MAFAKFLLNFRPAIAALFALPLLIVASGSDAKTLYRPRAKTVASPIDPLRAVLEIGRLAEMSKRCSYTVTVLQLARRCGSDVAPPLKFTELTEVSVRSDSGDLVVWVDSHGSRCCAIPSPDENQARIVANAIYSLAQTNRPHALAPDLTFEASVAVAKASGDRTEAQRRAQVQAEAVLAENRPSAAALVYREALATSPDWSQGHYNLALVYGSLKLYPAAITEMRRYLFLDPKATDARAAQDQIYGWEAKSGGL